MGVECERSRFSLDMHGENVEGGLPANLGNPSRWTSMWTLGWIADRWTSLYELICIYVLLILCSTSNSEFVLSTRKMSKKDAYMVSIVSKLC